MILPVTIQERLLLLTNTGNENIFYFSSCFTLFATWLVVHNNDHLSKGFVLSQKGKYGEEQHCLLIMLIFGS